MKTFRIHIITLWIAAIGSISSYAMGNEAEKASQLFSEGVTAFDAEHYTEAADRFRDANRIRHNWKVLYNIGQAEAAAKRYGLALEAFESYIAEGGDKIPENRLDEVHHEVRRLRDMTGTIDIKAPDGAIIKVDDVERGVAPLPGSLLVAAGTTHVLRVVQDGQEIYTTTIKLNGGQTRELSVTNESETTSDEGANSKANNLNNTNTVEQNTDFHRSGDGLKLTGWILLGTGVAVLAAGAVTGGVALSRKSSFDSECGSNATVVCSATAQQNLDQSKTAGNISTAMFISGGVLTATAIVLLIAAKKKEFTQTARPILGRGVAGIQLTHQF
ncbi:MAG: PEGA domain-containing protein [Deltaproteobacteria bacterium]|nr:PEGA domain-containing protein [Deltaproteobacteria bacterium]